MASTRSGPADISMELPRDSDVANNDTASGDAANRTFAVAELLENILIHLTCPKTLLLSQKVCTQWRDSIKASTKLQKKLFFLPTTFEEALALNMVQAHSTISLRTSGEAILFNELLIANVAYRDDYNRGSFYLSKGVNSNTASVRRGISSWESMYLGTRSDLAATPYYLVTDSYTSDPCDKGDVVEADQETTYKETKLRDLMDWWETLILKEYGTIFIWRMALFEFYGQEGNFVFEGFRSNSYVDEDHDHNTFTMEYIVDAVIRDNATSGPSLLPGDDSFSEHHSWCGSPIREAMDKMEGLVLGTGDEDPCVTFSWRTVKFNFGAFAMTLGTFKKLFREVEEEEAEKD